MNNNKRIILSLIFMSILFLSLLAYLTYFEFVLKDNAVVNSYNQRLNDYEESIIRGSIYDREGTVLAYSEGEGPGQIRVYPYNNTYSQIIGYSSKTYGKTLLEAKYNSQLLGLNELKVIMDIKNEVTGQSPKGDDLYLTIDHDLQQLGEDLLKGKSGAIVALKPNTGEVLAMVSKPDYNPNEQSLVGNWNDLVGSTNSPLLNRATQGLYAPGSTYKIAIASSALENGLASNTYEDKGSVVIDGKEFRNYNGKAYGTIDLTQALSYSSNVVFAQLGVSLGQEKLIDLGDRLGFNKSFDFNLPVKKSTFSYKEMTKADQAAVALGQGKLLVTPLHMAMITSGIANDGTMLEPYLLEKVTGIGESKFRNNKKTLSQITTKGTADEINRMMQEVVNKGTGKKAAVQGIQVAGKTGTAQNELSKDHEKNEHAWFVGFAPAEDPQIAVAIIVEYNGSTGGEVAAPMARKLFEKWLR